MSARRKIVLGMPTVDFIDLSNIRPELMDIETVVSGVVERRTLNASGDAVASSAVLDFAPGTVLRRTEVTVPTEIFTLAGRALLGNVMISEYCYMFRPPGTVFDPVRVGAQGLQCMLFQGWAADSAEDIIDDHGGSVGPIHLRDVGWELPRTDGFPAGSARKTLRDDPSTGRGFWALGLLPHWSSQLREWHTATEENFILEGEIETSIGLMKNGSYLCHEAGQRSIHGPMRSRRGALLLTRVHGFFGTTYVSSDEHLRGQW